MQNHAIRWQTLVNAVLDELIRNMCEEPVESKGLKSERIEMVRFLPE